MAAAATVHAIREGTFPDDEATLSSPVDAATIPSLLTEISIAKGELSDIVITISKEEAPAVDSWIAQAKKVQEDIARCKEDARQIIEEHERIESLRVARDEVRAKVDLLEEELVFNQTLRKQIDLISETSLALNKVDADIRQQHLVAASQTLPGLQTTIGTVGSEQARALLSSIHVDLVEALKNRLKTELHQCCTVATAPEHVELEILGPSHERQDLSLQDVLDSLDRLDALETARTRITRQIEGSILPHLHKRSRLKLTGANIDNVRVKLTLSATNVQATEVVSAATAFIQYVYQRSPPKLRDWAIPSISAKIVSALIDHWLDAAIPVDLVELKYLEELRHKVDNLADQLQEYHVSEATALKTWINNIPQTWLDKRRMASLDAVRKAFKLATGATRQVERIERQTVVVDQADSQHNATDDEWAENWDEDEHDTHDASKQSQSTGDDGSDAWGFDMDEPKPDEESAKDKDHGDDDDGEAWGWGDDDETATKPPTEKPPLPQQANGVAKEAPREEDLVLTENYTITDIPDNILEQIGRDNSDMQILAASPHIYFTSNDAGPPAMQSLPTLVLSMYRAISPTLYVDGAGSLPSLSTMNLYNDTLYLGQKISEHPELSSLLQPDIQALNKFARQLYTTELGTQRQILADLLDNAQGFIGCTREPNASVCDTAVSSTTDYLRSLHKQWSSILSPSHLAQSTGSLLSSIMSKMIKDVEDMEDISEPESQRLLSFMERISKMEDLFLTTPPSPGRKEGDEAPVSTIAVHVPSYLRFQYLQQILDSSLVDIKYLWTDAGLSLEFSAVEVVDLIKALFAESSHRRNAIQAIRG